MVGRECLPLCNIGTKIELLIDMNQIPTVDLEQYIQGNEAERQAFVKTLGDSFADIGFAIVSNHGVAQTLIEKAYEAFRTFFALPDQIKAKYEIHGLAGQRGYTSRGKEHAKGRSVGDLKEFYHVGQILSGAEAQAYGYPENVFPEEVPDMEVFGVRLYQSLETAGMHLLRAIATYLELPQEYFDDKIRNGNSILRPIHYYGIEDPDAVPADAVRAAEHEDINLITLLIGASAEGLQVLDKQSEWIDAKPEPHQIVINVGDMLQRLTNDRLKSTTHRVVNPPRERMHEPRYSVPFFLHPVSSMDLSVLPSCVDDAHPKAYEDISAGQYLEQRLREIGLKQ
jgi:isopenicillin N synthase-like dioxygenase